ncbi:MAG: helix-turn-helix transcriptional regulator [Clostridia bacterium]|nr:helix-turn-helix transcriptional regulator [Clostridia bacterium]
MNISAESAVFLLVNSYYHPADKNTDVVLSHRPTSSIAYMETGIADFCSTEVTFTAQAGDLVFVPVGASYSIHYKSDTRYVSAHFNFPADTGFFSRRVYPMQKLEGSPEAHTLLREMFTLQNAPDGAISTLTRFYRLCELTFPRLIGTPPKKFDPRIERAAARLSREFNLGISVEPLAAECHLSSSHFHALFKKEVGMSPVEYRLHAAIRFAQQLLIEHPEMSIEEVTEASGFESAAYFRRVFGRIVGKSPRDYRKSVRDQMPF